jgi:Zn finger protein HypA/HybF involved in hydrogenase expression
MAVKVLDPNALGQGEDWQGNNATFTCPCCRKVFIVSAVIHQGSRDCPGCGKSTGNVAGGKDSGGSAYIRYEDSN